MGNCRRVDVHNSFELVCLESGGQRCQSQLGPPEPGLHKTLVIGIWLGRTLDLEFFQQRLSQYLEVGQFLGSMSLGSLGPRRPRPRLSNRCVLAGFSKI